MIRSLGLVSSGYFVSYPMQSDLLQLEHESNNQCCICHDKECDTKLSCNHTACRLCLVMWALEKNKEKILFTCPVCR